MISQWSFPFRPHCTQSTSPVKTAGIYPQHFWNALQIYLYGKCLCKCTFNVWSGCVCTPAAPLAATAGRRCGLESQQESVCPSSLRQTSTNQQKQMDVYLGGLGTVENVEEIRNQELFYYFHIYWKHPWQKRTILGNAFFQLFHVFPIPSFFQFSGSLNTLSLSSLPPHFNDPPFPRPPLFKLLSEFQMW